MTTHICIDKLLDMATELYIKNYLKRTSNALLPLDQVPPPTRHDFKEVLIIMTKNKINCMPIYKNFQAFYLQFMSQLGNQQYNIHALDDECLDLDSDKVVKLRTPSDSDMFCSK